MNASRLIREPWPRIIGIPIVSLVVVMLYNQGSFGWDDYLISALFVTVMWNGDYYIIRYLRTVWPSLDDTYKRILITILFVCVYNISADYLVCNFLNYLELNEDYWATEPVSNILKNLMITAVIGTIYEAGYFFSKWKIQAIETEQLRNRQLKSELSALKNQISPHFLFNSLNTLVTLIHEDQKQAAKFTEKLSEVYRYILQVKDREFISLKTELEFCRSYIFLLKMRFERGLEVNIDIPDREYEKFVVPLTLQMLVENAVKHNVVSRNNPLQIEIYTEKGESLIVKNNLNVKSAEGKSTKKGLENIRSRYSLLTARDVDVIRTRDHFMVALPLVEPIVDDESIHEELRL
jgi:hypothetical protein